MTEFKWTWWLRVAVAVIIVATVFLTVTGVAGWLVVLHGLGGWQWEHTGGASTFAMCWVIVVGFLVFRHRVRKQAEDLVVEDPDLTGLTVGEVVTTLVDEANDRGPLGGLYDWPSTWPDSKAEWIWPTEGRPTVHRRVCGLTVEGTDMFLVEAFPASTAVPFLRMAFTELFDTDPAVCVVHTAESMISKVFVPSPGHRVLTREQFDVAANNGFDPDRLGYTSEGRLVLAAAFSNPE